jgi:hypothetical protein
MLWQATTVMLPKHACTTHTESVQTAPAVLFSYHIAPTQE